MDKRSQRGFSRIVPRNRGDPMLNTQSRSASALIWLTILVIAVRASWTMLGLGSPSALWQTIAESEVSAVLGRNQLMITGLVGIAALTFAYLFNGWRDRTERRHSVERAEQRLATVLSREASGLATALEDVAKAAVSGGGVASARSRLADATSAEDRLLLSAPMPDLARLGAGATAAIQAVRRGVRRLSGSSDYRDEAPGRQVAVAAIEAAFAARDAVRVLDTLASKGPAAADRLRLMSRSEGDVRALLPDLGETTTSARLLPAA